MIIGLVRDVNHFHELIDEMAHQIKDIAAGLPVDIYSLMSIEKVIKQISEAVFALNSQLSLTMKIASTIISF